MKIAVIADPYIPVPPSNYGGIERIIDFLVREYKELGHDVLLLAHPDSNNDALKIKYKDQASPIKHLNNLLAVNKLKSFNPDVIHSFGRLLYLLPFLFSKVPILMSYQREPTIEQIKKVVSLKFHNLSFTGCSNYITDQIKPFAKARTVYNGFPKNTYTPNFQIEEDAPLVFLGRIEQIKGTHIAIDVALKTNKKLIIAGNIPENETQYFENKIKPFLNDNISYIGPVIDVQKNKLLSSALAFLMPITWNEPFGIVMAEAMACGTPVIGFRRGSVPEVVQHGINGFICCSVEQMIESIDKVKELNRSTISIHANNKFSSQIIAKQYLEIYKNEIRKELK